MNSADTADQMMKMTLEGIEVAAEIAMKAGGFHAEIRQGAQGICHPSF